MVFRKLISVSRPGLSFPLLSYYVRQSKNESPCWTEVLERAGLKGEESSYSMFLRNRATQLYCSTFSLYNSLCAFY